MFICVRGLCCIWGASLLVCVLVPESFFSLLCDCSDNLIRWANSDLSVKKACRRETWAVKKRDAKRRKVRKEGRKEGRRKERELGRKRRVT